MRYLKRTFDIILGAYLLFLAILAVPSLLGYEVYTVVSKSMAPAIDVGAAVFVKENEFEEICEGDVITFMLGENRTCVTHRVVGQDVQTRSFVTQGDANKQADGNLVAYEDVVGVVRFSVPYLGYLELMLEDSARKMLLVGILAWLFLMDMILTDLLMIRKREVHVV